MMVIMWMRATPLLVALGSSACGLATDFHGNEEPAATASSGDAASSTVDAASTAQSGGQTTSSGGAGGGDVASTAAAAGGVADGDGGSPPGVPFCGDRVIDELEECDDGNGKEGDGCGPTCRIECAAGEVARVSTRTCLALTIEEDETLDWSDARASCEESGGDLVVLLELTLPSFDGRLGLAHVGAHRVASDFEWVDGSEVEATIEEDDAGDCVAVRVDDDGNNDLLAVACSLPLAFVCERDPTSLR